MSKFDVIKLGRMKFRIKDLVCAGQQNNQAELHEQDLKEAHQVTFIEPNVDEEGREVSCSNSQGAATSGACGSEKPAQSQCRFCWGTESSLENPCIVPCNCSGTVGFIHYLCLKNWLQLKM